MSLQVWLPLNGNLNNYGLSNVTVTNSGATVNDSGKIGKCYQFGQNKKITSVIDIHAKPISASCWICLDSFQGSYDYILSLNNSGGYSDQSISVALESTTKIVFCVGGSSGCVYNNSTTLVGKWTHLAVTFDGSKIKGYVNGVEVCSLNSTASLKRSNLTLGCRNGNEAYYTNCKLNDVRIYDHCLSPKEIKEISKGLVLHYTMDENVQQLNNCFNYPTFNKSTASGGWSHWAPSGSTGSYSQNTDKTYIYNKNQTYSHKVSHLTGTYYLCYQSPAFEGGFRSVQAIIKLEDGSHPAGKVSFTHNANVLNKPTEYIELGDGFYLMRKQGFKQNGSNDLVSIYLANNAVVYISEAYLENDREVCSDILNLRSTIVHDSSGYLHDGTITGNLSVANDSPRYKVSTFISNGLTNYIKTPTINIAGDAITVNIWIKSTNTTPTGSYHMPFQSNTNNYVEFSITKSGLFMCGLYVNGTRYITNISDVNVLDGNWHMLSVTYNGANIKRYIDGILKSTTAISGTLNCTSQLYWIGRRSTTTYAALDMYFSDIRMYTTALSDDDIKELYDTAAIIDNGHNMHCYEFVEDDVTSPMIEKNGLVKTNEFNEYPDDYIFYDYIESTGTQYINLDLFGNGDVIIDAQCTNIGTVSRVVFGTLQAGTAGTWYGKGTTYKNWGVGVSGTHTSTIPSSTRAMASLTLSSTGIDGYVDDEHIYRTANVTQGVWHLFSCPSGKYPFVGKVFSFKGYKNNTLVRNLFPAKRKSDNAIGMYDMITGRFFGNSGTGAFTTGTPMDVAAMYEHKIDLNQLLEI